MDSHSQPITIVIADDDEDDRMMMQEALNECCHVGHIDFVANGEELLDYLHHRGCFAHLADNERPGLILLDLNMPRKDGREALKEIKSDPKLRRIPVVVMTTSRAEEDIARTYDLGANSYITKPLSFEALVATMRAIGTYWLEVVNLPPESN